MSFSSTLRKMRGIVSVSKPFRSSFHGEKLLSPAWMRLLGGRFWYSAEETRSGNNVLKPRAKTPLGKLDQMSQPKESLHSDPYAPFPNNTNPLTGEVGGPTGPEPTRYGDWERKGRVSDF